MGEGRKEEKSGSEGVKEARVVEGVGRKEKKRVESEATQVRMNVSLC